MQFAFAPQFPVFFCSLWGDFISLRGQLPPTQFTLKNGLPSVTSRSSTKTMNELGWFLAYELPSTRPTLC